MTKARIRYQTLEIGHLDVHLRTLRDLQQFSDDEGLAEALGIGPASWPLFGVVWDAGLALASEMLTHPVGTRRVLEVGCGIGVASIVLSLLRADITATDHHPEAEEFLRRNVELNGGPAVPFVRAGWDDETSGMTDFDLIIGGDVLYERGHPESLSRFIDRHARPTCEVIIADAGRRQAGRFGRSMTELGYDHRELESQVGNSDNERKIRFHRYVR